MTQLTLLDGGMGKELRRIGAPFRQPEWSALALIEAPEFVLEAHHNFIEAGAEVVITNNYAVVPYHLGEERMAEQGNKLTALSGRLARQAADEVDRPVAVAGSLPPLFASYEPDRFDADRAPAFYDAMVQELEPFVDFWIAETMSAVEEAHAIGAAVAAHGGDKPLWLSFALPDRPPEGRSVLYSGQTIAQIVGAAAASPAAVEAVLFNCSLAERIGPALTELAGELGDRGLDVRFGGYANGFPDARDDAYTANTMIFERRDDLNAEGYADIVGGWVAAGASIIGGCCDTYPADIAMLHQRFLADS